MDRRRDTCQDEDQETEQVDQARSEDRPVLAPELIGDDGTGNRCQVAKELEEGGEKRRYLLTTVQGTWLLVVRPGDGELDVVLEGTCDAVEGEPFA